MRDGLQLFILPYRPRRAEGPLDHASSTCVLILWVSSGSFTGCDMCGGGRARVVLGKAVSSVPQEG